MKYETYDQPKWSVMFMTPDAIGPDDTISTQVTKSAALERLEVYRGASPKDYQLYYVTNGIEVIW